MASIRKATSRAGGTSYRVLFRQGQKQTSMTFGDAETAERFRTLVDALGPDRALKALAEEAEGTDDRLTVGGLADAFLEWKARDVTPRTAADYRRDVEKWIKPALGHRVAELVDEIDVQEWVDAMARELSPKSVADRHMLLHSMYRFGKARTRRLVTHNPCEETELPKPARRRAKGTTVAQWRAVLEVAAERNPDARDLVEYLGVVGWRFSEATALPVRAVEERVGGRVWVDMTQVFRIVEGRQVLVADAAKSYAGFRNVPVPSSATGQMLLRRCVGKGPDDFVFTNSRGNHWNQHTFLRDTWPGLLRRAGLWRGPRKSPTPHWLRHMAVAVLAASGASASEIQRFVGHEDISTTMGTYGGMLGGMRADVLAAADELLAGRGDRGLVVAGEVVAADSLIELGP